MTGYIRRAYLPQTVSVTASAGTTGEIPFEECAGGMIFVPTGSALTSLTFHAADKPGGTFYPAYDADGNALTRTVAQTRAYPIPSALYGAGAIKIVGNDVGTVIVVKKG